MAIELMAEGRFRGWYRLRRPLAALPVAEASVSLARVVAELMASHDGTFVGGGSMNATNHHLMERLLLQRWDAEQWRSPSAALAQRVAQMHGRLMPAYCALTGARGRHRGLSRNLRAPLWYRVVSSVWVASLEQEFVNRAPKQELARAWILYKDVWPRIETAGKVTVPAPSQTAFASIDYALLLVVAVWHHRGFIADLRAALRDTNIGQGTISTLLDCYTHPAPELVAADNPALYPGEGFANPFARAPLLRIGDASVFCPDPSVLFAGVEYRVLQQALGGDFVRTSRAFGHVFEAYGGDLLQAAHGLGGRFLPEFRYPRAGEQVDTPDAFILGARSVVFEFKALRYPFEVDQSGNVRAFVAWISKLVTLNTLFAGTLFTLRERVGLVTGWPGGRELGLGGCQKGSSSSGGSSRWSAASR